ncbi:hypothetical protein ACFV0T_09700 [Streptomyces sp. NPDC059582]|uniref:hypothetical protein n=1 Tax=Streptomyces sp. NPDC059582 TaxID=3346875 RepID=UPI0036775B92
MRQRMNLDEAAARLEVRRPRWLAAGLRVSPALWTPDRAHLAVRVTAPGWQVELTVEAHQGGWAYVHFASATGTLQEARRVGSPAAWDALLDDSVARASRLRMRPAKLLAGTCTTGWLDWVHGELWLLPDALVRVRSGLLGSVVNSTGGSGVTPRAPYRVMGYDPEAIRAAHRTNKVIPLAEIERARLHGGVTTSGMTLTMADGTHHKLLWLSSEPARRLLRDRLLPTLGPRLAH